DTRSSPLFAAKSAPGMSSTGMRDALCQSTAPKAGSRSVITSYHSTKDLRERFRCSSRTIFRRMKRAENPFPAPCIRHAGSFNLWDGDEIVAWEERERELARIVA